MRRVTAWLAGFVATPGADHTNEENGRGGSDP